MQTQMEDEYPEVVNLKNISEGLKKILGDESKASARVDEQVNDFVDCWTNLAYDIQEKIRKVCAGISRECRSICSYRSCFELVYLFCSDKQFIRIF